MDLYAKRCTAAFESPQIVDFDAPDDVGDFPAEDRIVELSFRLDELLYRIDEHAARLDDIAERLAAVVSGRWGVPR